MWLKLQIYVVSMETLPFFTPVAEHSRSAGLKKYYFLNPGLQ